MVLTTEAIIAARQASGGSMANRAEAVFLPFEAWRLSSVGGVSAPSSPQAHSVGLVSAQSPSAPVTFSFGSCATALCAVSSGEISSEETEFPAGALFSAGAPFTGLFSAVASSAGALSAGVPSGTVFIAELFSASDGTPFSPETRPFSVSLSFISIYITFPAPQFGANIS